MSNQLPKTRKDAVANRLKWAKGFTLVEVSIALGIVAFMVLPLVSLAVYAKDAIQDATAETHASDVAQRIFACLSVSTLRSGVVFESAHDETSASEAFESIPIEELFASGGEFFLLVDRNGRVIERADQAAFEQGYPGTSLLISGGSFARVRVLGKRASVYQGDTVIGGPGLFLMEVNVQTPAVAPQQARRSHSFHAYLTLSDSISNQAEEPK
jgi:prepilin-type N-terminal cleavage/methylation domain-containing protein